MVANETLKKRLEEERDRLKRDIEGLERQSSTSAGPPSERDAYGNHLADEASSDTFEQEKLLALEAHMRGLLSSVEHALQKFGTSAYGRCERCGRDIGIERLQALPYAPLCIECKSKQEKESQRR
ncbi:MAG: TraR/DksA C4-type zinc finger protein [Chloroflexi bacterium]|nr:TraR/DksA C4-type zinc finger protein [Chloroflexota bacterium]